MFFNVNLILFIFCYFFFFLYQSILKRTNSINMSTFNMDIPSVLLFILPFLKTLVARDVRSFLGSDRVYLISQLLRWCYFNWNQCTIRILSLFYFFLFVIYEHIYVYTYIRRTRKWKDFFIIRAYFHSFLSFFFFFRICVQCTRNFLELFCKILRCTLIRIYIHMYICSDTTIVGHTNKTACTFTKS